MPDMAGGSAAPDADAENRWPGLGPFTEADEARFFGRSEEIARLFACVARDAEGRPAARSATLLLGRPGVGKTSVLRAGLFPRLRAAGFLPVYIRLEHGERRPDYRSQVQSAVERELDKLGIERAGSSLLSRMRGALIDELKRTIAAAAPRVAAVVLAFDQFDEDVGLLGMDRLARERRDAALAELADLVRLDSCRVLVALREEFLAEYETVSGRLGVDASCRVHLDAITTREAVLVVRGMGGRHVTPEAAAAIVRLVAEGPSADARVAPWLLSVATGSLDARRRAAGREEIDVDMVPGSLGELLRDAYTGANFSPAVRRLLEEGLITEAGVGRRVLMDDALRTYGVPVTYLQRLAASGLLRVGLGSGGARWMELAHDALAAAARQSRDAVPAANAHVMNAHALLVDVDHGDRTRIIDPRRDVTREATAVRRALTAAAGGYAPERVRSLVDREATRDRVLSELDAIVSRADADATVLLYFACPGTTVPGPTAAGSVGLLPFDFAEGRFLTTALLDERLARARARHVVVVAVSDFAEGIIGGGPGRVWISATRADEKLYDHPGRGRFTRALVDGIRGAAAGADGAVRVLDLFEYAYRVVVADSHGLEHPTIGGDLSDNFVVAASSGEVPNALAPTPDGYRYDAYLSAAASDPSPARDALVARLVDAGLRIAMPYRDQAPGTYGVATVERGVRQSRRWLASASHAYAGSEAERAFTGAVIAADGGDGEPRTLYLVPDDADRAMSDVRRRRSLALGEVLRDDARFSALVAWLRGETATVGTEAGSHPLAADVASHLSRWSRRALRLAESYRRESGLPCVDTAHLMAGLYQKGMGWTRALINLADTDARWADLSALATLMHVESAPTAVLPHVEAAPASALDDVVLSDGARQAIEAAVRLAGDSGPGSVRGRHLLTGILSLDDAAARWLSDALRIDRVALHQLLVGWLRVDLSSEAIDDASLSALRAPSARRTLPADSQAQTLAFSPHGTALAAGYADGSVRVWGVTRGELLAELAAVGPHAIDRLVWSPDGAVLAAGAREGGARVWWWAEHSPSSTSAPTHHLNSAFLPGLAFSPDGRWLVGRTVSGGVRLWAVSTMTVYEVAPGAPDDVGLDVAFTPDAQYLVAVGDGALYRLALSAAGPSRPVPAA